MFILKAKKLCATARLPEAAHPGDLGCDLFASADVTIKSGEQTKVPTGLSLQFPDGWGGIVKDRSSMASKRIYTSAGVIDAGYRGEVLILMRNDNDTDFHINTGDKIAQIVPLKAPEWHVEEVAELDDTRRADGGFGSTGKR